MPGDQTEPELAIWTCDLPALSSRQKFGLYLVIVPSDAPNCWGFQRVALLATKSNKPLRARLAGA